MEDKLHTNTVILESYDEFEVNGKKKYVLNTTDGKYDLWKTKVDGTDSKAFQDFCALGELGCQITVGYVIKENGDYVNNIVRFIKKVGGNPVDATQQSNINLESRVAVLETKVAILMGKQEYINTPTQSGYQPQDVPLPPEPQEIRVEDIPF